ncbi:unnamed protein product, partial [marine sediment metagenome]
LKGATSAVQMDQEIFVQLRNHPSEIRFGGNGWVCCDSNGDFWFNCSATGVDTLNAWMYIYGYVLGE